MQVSKEKGTTVQREANRSKSAENATAPNRRGNERYMAKVTSRNEKIRPEEWNGKG